MRLLFVLVAGGVCVASLYNSFGAYRSVRAVESSLRELRLQLQQDRIRLENLQKLPYSRPDDLSGVYARLTLFLQDLIRAEGVSVYLQTVSSGQSVTSPAESVDGLDSSRLQVALGSVRDRAMLGRVLAAVSGGMRSGLFELEQLKQTKDALTVVIVLKGNEVKG